MNYSSSHHISGMGTELHGSVLIIENDELVSTAMNDILSASGLTVYLAHDGVVGEEMYRTYQSDIDMVILDWRLPRQNGSDTLRKIRQINPNAQIMVSSGYSEEDVVDQLGEQKVAVSFLSKPFDIDSLLNKIGQLLA